MSKARDYVFYRYFRGPHLITLALVGVLSLAGCQDSSGTGSGGSTSTQKSSGDALGDGTSQTTYYDYSESFVADSLEVKALGKPVHMLWAVDAIGSYSDFVRSRYEHSRPGYDASGKDMADEIAAINTHLPLLIKSLKEVSVVQTTLMSDASRYSGPVVDRGFMEIIGVDKKNFGVLRSPGLYLQKYIKYTTTDCRVDPTHTLRCHPSEDFFRDPKALKVIISVSDRGIGVGGGEYFLGLLKEFSADISSFRFFALIDLRDSYLNKLCYIRDDGRQCNHSYTYLVEKLGGDKYHTNNISASEWTKVFAQLKSKIVEEIGGDSGEKKQKATFTLKRPASKILELKVEGQSLAKTSFQVTGNTLYIDAEHVSEGQNIVVKYQSTQSS